MQSNNFFSLEQFIDRNPLQVKPNLLLTEVIKLMQEWGNSCRVAENQDDPESNAIPQSNNSCALVVVDSQLKGLFSERDLVYLVAEGIDISKITVEEVMSQELIVLTLTGSEDIFTALNLMRQHRIRHLPIVDDRHQLLGLVTEKNVRQNLQPMNLMKWRRVEEIMTTMVIHAPTTVSVRKVAQLIANHGVSCVAIVEKQECSGLLIPLGIITERDIVQFQNLNLNLEQPAEKLMSSPLFLVSPQDSLWSIHQLMKQHRVRRLLVAGNQGELTGIITQSSLLQVLDPMEMYGLIEELQRQVCQLENERAEFWQNRTVELEQQVQTELNQRQQVEIAKNCLTGIVEATTDFVVTVDVKGHTLYLNQAGRKMMGFGEDEDLSNITVPIYCSPWAVKVVNEGLTHASIEGVWEGELELLSHHGREIPVSQVIIAHKKSDGSVTSFSTIIRDISDRKQIEADLKYRVEFEQLIARIATNFINLTSVELNQEIQDALRLIGEFTQVETSYVFQIAHQSNTMSMTHEWVKPAIKASIQKAQNLPFALFPWSIAQLQQGEIVQVTSLANLPIANLPIAAEIDRQNWQRFNLRSLISVPLICQGTFIGWLGFASFNKEETWSESSINLLRIIGEMFANALHRQQAEAKIREQAALLDVATDAIMVRGLDSQILFWNRGAEKLYGWTQEEVLEQDANHLLYQEFLPKLNEIRQLVTEKDQWQGELQQITKAGQEIVVLSRWTLVKDEEGNPQSFLVVNTDITEKKQLENQFLRAQRLESLGTLASGIAHDLNNIFTPILAVTQILPRHLPELEPNLQELLSICQNNVQRGVDLVKQILTFTRGAEGERGLVQVQHLIREIQQIAQETFPKTIELQTSVSKNLWTVNGDATQLHQVLMNLVVNARDAMANGGTLRISAKNYAIEPDYARRHLEAQEGEYVLVTVADTGTGISADIQERVFEPFFTTKEIGHGTGLGLSTVLGIVKSHGGFIDIQSEVGQGSQFRVFLPADKTTATVIKEIEELPRGNGELILVVDDEAPIRAMSKTILETYNYRVLTANNGIEAMTIYSQHQNEIEVVLIDIMMPLIDGQVVIRTLQKIKPQVKIIAVSGLVTKDISTELKDSCCACLAKPYTTEALLTTIHRVILSRSSGL